MGVMKHVIKGFISMSTCFGDWYGIHKANTLAVMEAPSDEAKTYVKQPRVKAEPHAPRAGAERAEKAQKVIKKRKIAATAEKAGGRAMRLDVTCFSRSDPESVGCNYDNCIFSHACASCGEDHMARDCPSWDVSKTRKNRRV